MTISKRDREIEILQKELNDVKAAHAPCKAWFRARWCSSRIKRKTDTCSCGEKIRYLSRADGGVVPPPTTTNDVGTCPLTAHGHALVPGL